MLIHHFCPFSFHLLLDHRCRNLLHGHQTLLQLGFLALGHQEDGGAGFLSSFVAPLYSWRLSCKFSDSCLRAATSFSSPSIRFWCWSFIFAISSLSSIIFHSQCSSWTTKMSLIILMQSRVHVPPFAGIYLVQDSLKLSLHALPFT